LRISTPKFKNNTIIYSVPSNTAAVEINTEKQHLLLFIRNKLNSKIDFSVKIDKRIEKKSAFTNKEKYELLKGKNSSIHNLKEKFKLSI
jgi:hypothetical protein